jgi:23S rRNA pseudouridine2605 synthase
VREKLQKILSAAGVASRRGAEELVRSGRVRVNGVQAELGDRADPDRDRIEIDGAPLTRAPLVYWLLHKPQGVLTTRRDPFGRPTVLELIPSGEERIFPVGRLDRDTEGLLLLTNDGGVAQALLHPALGTEREYQVTVKGRIPAAKLRRLAAGVELRDGRTAAARVVGARFQARSHRTTFRLILREGRKRQIRRSLSALGHPVERLVRLRMGPLRLGSLGSGEARRLEAQEAAALRRYARLRLRDSAPSSEATRKADPGSRKGGAQASKPARKNRRPPCGGISITRPRILVSKENSQ